MPCREAAGQTADALQLAAARERKAAVILFLGRGGKLPVPPRLDPPGSAGQRQHSVGEEHGRARTCQLLQADHPVLLAIDHMHGALAYDRGSLAGAAWVEQHMDDGGSEGLAECRLTGCKCTERERVSPRHWMNIPPLAKDR